MNDRFVLFTRFYSYSFMTWTFIVVKLHAHEDLLYNWTKIIEVLVGL
jgi:hypothetical protein